ncbi:LOW QUALITY PROTEIN: Uncharacterized protein GBIM_13164 [Gryllus bimaculatus]|nr:LOW QUALITY PROTEIN: Uncharacterized protein GBIM_13164 [Gryllus bimaculatus]
MGKTTFITIVRCGLHNIGIMCYLTHRVPVKCHGLCHSFLRVTGSVATHTRNGCLLPAILAQHSQPLLSRGITSRIGKDRIFTCLKRNYHSRNGVYGYRPRAKEDFRVPPSVQEIRIKQNQFYNFVMAYRQHGHKMASVNPLVIDRCTTLTNIQLHHIVFHIMKAAVYYRITVPDLDPSLFGLQINDQFQFSGILFSPKQQGTVLEAIQHLNNSYTSHLSAEFLHLEENEEKEWFAKAIEEIAYTDLDNTTRKGLATDLLKSQAFDNFLATKFVTVKRYGAEGAESMMGFYSELFKLCAEDGLEQIILCMPHRGRLNFLTGLLHFPPAMIFRKLKGLSEFPSDAKATANSVDLHIDGKIIHVTLLYNPSHLEAVNPVSMGKARARQQSLGDGAYSDTANWSDKVLNFQVHGDAAFAGQGVNQEMLNMTSVPHFEVGGSVHLIVNNQLGFTTPGERGRSTTYCSDLAKMISAPVLHVNGDYPEMVVKAARLAVAYQRKFRKDVFVDLMCFRRWGHNELDDPTFTNPAVYRIITSRRSVPDMYVNSLVEEGVMTQDEASSITNECSSWLNSILKNLDTFEVQKFFFKRQWANINQAPAALTTWDTGVDINILKYVGTKSVSYPETFSIHSHLLKTHVNARMTKISNDQNIDWATAEALAVGSLLYQGHYVRLSGQDVGRGTFSHRHFMIIDQVTNDMFIPLNNLINDQKGFLEIANSTLSEEAVLAFEYGMSIESPQKLIIWEAQFGDFFNGAQIQIDTFVTGGETKWMVCSGLVILLPHGYDGAGPEHSSSRIERFLQMTDSKENFPDGDDVNMHIANPTTPAQYFHLLRRQMVRDYRKPLVVISPKILLRYPDATSSLNEMIEGTSFLPVLGDNSQADHIKKIILVSGKHFYALDKYRKESGIQDTAIIRLEGLVPFPTPFLQEVLSKYKHAKCNVNFLLQMQSCLIFLVVIVDFVWSQEEPQNMGAWSYVKPRFENLLGRKLKYSGRPPLATPAVGIGEIHQKEAQDVVRTPRMKSIKKLRIAWFFGNVLEKKKGRNAREHRTMGIIHITKFETPLI